MHLVIGGRGLIGTAVCEELERRNLAFIATTRDGRGRNMLKLDLLGFSFNDLPSMHPSGANAVYLIAAIPGFIACRDNVKAWVVNRDAPIDIARHYSNYSRNFIVFLSSDVVDKEYDWEYSAYPRQKAEVEAYINSINGAIIRPGKVTAARAPELAKVIVDVGISRRPGVTRWS